MWVSFLRLQTRLLWCELYQSMTFSNFLGKKKKVWSSRISRLFIWVYHGICFVWQYSSSILRDWHESIIHGQRKKKRKTALKFTAFENELIFYYNNIRKFTSMAEINKLPAIQITNTVKHSENKWEHVFRIRSIFQRFRYNAVNCQRNFIGLKTTKF